MNAEKRGFFVKTMANALFSAFSALAAKQGVPFFEAVWQLVQASPMQVACPEHGKDAVLRAKEKT